MTDSRVFKLPENLPSPADLAEAWSKVIAGALNLAATSAQRAADPHVPHAYDPAASAQAFGAFAAHLWSNPAELYRAQQKAAADWMRLWGHAGARAAGAEPEPLAAPARGDRRFSDPAWSEEPLFDYLKQAYLLTAERAVDMVDKAEGLDEATRTKVGFFTRQYLDAISPANFAFSNPEAIRRAIDTGSISLLSGLANMLADAAEAPGIVRRRTGDAFELGVDIAATPGSVVYQNALMQLIQYAPATDEAWRKPVLYVPPLVNKYYLLDLQPKSSLIRWLVEQGHTVFVISWVNPGSELANMDMADYIKLGPVAALDAIEQATGERAADMFGFCMGGTLVGMTLAYLAGKGESDRVASATTIGSLFDFRNLGQWSTFTEPEQLRAMERHLIHKGFMAAQDLQALFSAVRANDLIWSSVVNHYLMDKEAPPSDILYWFADGAHIPRAFLLSYAQQMLRDNKLKEPGGVVLDGVPLDLSAVKTPLLAISLKDDHVSAWQATYDGARLFGGEVGFLLGGSGHNAGVINPPSANKHGYWTNDALPDTAEAWFEGATRSEGSWWPHWQGWLSEGGEAEKVPARVPGDGALEAIEPAPGSYVRNRG
ncbi:MAG: poly[(R)-3-hydroxyalkanoate] polymerase subunit PhaC [Sphingomonadales bacterium]|jgi:polyhydroxyalkanoate synthase|nr:poly[(R)-3-hydroxyalkanoate] polymerase subunit PhaC [Sphingomonadales bacterium]